MIVVGALHAAPLNHPGESWESSFYSSRRCLYRWSCYDCGGCLARCAIEPSWRVLGEKLHSARKMRLPRRANAAMVHDLWRGFHHWLGSHQAVADWHLLEVRGWWAWP